MAFKAPSNFSDMVNGHFKVFQKYFSSVHQNLTLTMYIKYSPLSAGVNLKSYCRLTHFLNWSVSTKLTGLHRTVSIFVPCSSGLTLYWSVSTKLTGLYRTVSIFVLCSSGSTRLILTKMAENSRLH